MNWRLAQSANKSIHFALTAPVTAELRLLAAGKDNLLTAPYGYYKPQKS